MSFEDAEALLAERKLHAARAAFNVAEASGEDADRAAGGRWLTAMLGGEFEAAWQESDALRSRGAPDPHRFWDGAPIAGKRLIVRCLHGLGDAAQMLRFAPMLQSLAAHVTWEVPPKLLNLAACFDGVEDVVTWGAQAPLIPPRWESQVEVMELPYLLRVQQEDLPVAAAYCSIPVAAVDRVRAVMTHARPNVGIVWAAASWNPARSIPFYELESLMSKPGINFWSLQGDQARSQATAVMDATTICGDGLVALAATIANLDLVITVDTLAAHLTGALGKPVWVMLEHAADWRWLAEGDRSAWYPTMRLFRQPTHGDWAAVMTQICIDIEKEFS